jgi:hypothetical protein
MTSDTDIRIECDEYRAALQAVVDELHGVDPDAALMASVYAACLVLDKWARAAAERKAANE